MFFGTLCILYVTTETVENNYVFRFKVLVE